jgi:ribosomal protein S18 acetylase RimI-like enzyme
MGFDCGITRSRHAALSVDRAGIFVDAKNANAVRFYKRYGFIACHEQPCKLYLPMW